MIVVSTVTVDARVIGVGGGGGGGAIAITVVPTAAATDDCIMMRMLVVVMMVAQIGSANTEIKWRWYRFVLPY